MNRRMQPVLRSVVPTLIALVGAAVISAQVAKRPAVDRRPMPPLRLP